MSDITYLTPREISEYKSELIGLEQSLREIPFSPYRRVRNMDTDGIKSRISHIKRLLDTRTAPIATGAERDKIARRVRELESEIKKGMPTNHEYMGKRKLTGADTHYQEAQENDVIKQMDWQRRTDALIREWKRLKRILEPDNPYATNVENLRPNKNRR